MRQRFEFLGIFLAVFLLVSAPAQAFTDTKEQRSWLSDLPIISQSLELSKPEPADLGVQCTIPSEFRRLANDLHNSSPYSDPIYLEWIKLYHLCSWAELSVSLEKNLQSPKPHMAAAMIWSVAKHGQGLLDSGWQQQTDPQLVRALGQTPELFRLYHSVDDIAAYQFIVSLPKESYTDDFWASQLVSWINGSALESPVLDDKIGMLKSNPEIFTSWWPSTWRSRKDRDALAELIAPGGALADHFIAPAIRRYVFEGRDDAQHAIEFADTWLSQYPNDFMALRMKGRQKKNLGHIEDASDAHLLEYAAAPFQPNIDSAIVLYMLNRKEEGDKMVAAVTSDSADPVRTQVYHNLALRNAGFANDARYYSKKLLESNPESLLVIRGMRVLEERAKNGAEALALARKGMNHPLADWGDAQTLINALKKEGLAKEAMGVFLASAKRFGSVNADMVVAAADAAKLAGEREQEKAFLEEALNLDIDRPQILRRLIKYHIDLEHWTGVVSVSRRLLTDVHGYRSDYARLFKAADALNPEMGVNEALEWARNKASNKGDSYYAAIEQFMSSGNRGKAVLLVEKARAEYPDHFWPVYLEGSVKGDDREFAEYDESVRAILPNLDSSDTEWAARDLTSKALTAFNKGEISKQRLKDYRPIFMSALAEMETEAAIRTGFKFFEALNEPDEATKLWQRNVLANPHDFSALRMLSTSLEVDRADVMPRVWDSLSRDRYNATRLKDWMHVHTKWSGSATLSYCLAEWARSHYPEASAVIKNREMNALATFGEDGRHFLNTYANATTISPSLRYVEWFLNTKKKALDGSKFVDFDCERGVVTIVDRQGEIEVQQKDYRTGKIALLAKNGAWVSYRYTDSGKISKLSGSDGRKIELTYNSINKIDRMVDNDGSNLSFQYDKNGKPNIIDAGAEGLLRITYNEEGEISEVTGYSKAGEENVESYRVALKITKMFQNLSALSKASAARSMVEKVDPDFKQAISVLEDMPRVSPSYVKKTISLLAKAKQGGHGGGNSLRALDKVVSRLLLSPEISWNSKQLSELGLELYKLYTTVSPFGLPDHRWQIWRSFLARAEQSGSGSRVQALLAKVRASPLIPMNNNNWSGTSLLRNKGFWQADSIAELLPNKMRSNLSISAILVRANGEIVASSSAGLIVRKRGVWNRYSFVADRNTWVQDAAGSIVSDPLIVNGLAELANGDLVIGTNRGVYIIRDNYEKLVARVATQSDGLPSAYVHDLHVNERMLSVATSRGLVSFRTNEDGIDTRTARLILPEETRFVGQGSSGSSLLAGTETGVYSVETERTTQIASIAAEDAIFSKNDNRVLILKGGNIFSSQLHEGKYTTAVPLTNSGSARLNETGYGFEKVQFGKDEAVIILGDEGYAVWHEGYFEFLELPNADQLLGVSAFGRKGDQLALATSNGVIYRFEPKAVGTRKSNPVVASAYDSSADIVYFADGSQITAALASEAGQPPIFKTFDRISARFLDIGADNRLIANDGNIILRYQQQSGQSEVLFEAEPYCPEDYSCNSKLTGLLAARDGSIWVTAGPSVFRWTNGDVKEYNYFKDIKEFPIDTNWIAGLLELPNGDIIISASNEGHLSYRGNAFHGQNLLFRNGKFEDFNDSAMFLSATETDTGTVIGSSIGFFESNGRHFTNLATAEDPSYLSVRNIHPNLYLGGEGARIGNTWLFPASAGIVGYQNGIWFYPERLNWQFPDPEKADLGGRHTYTLETDRAGRIYVGTDQGLLIFQQLGGNDIGLLVNNSRSDLAFSAVERQKLQKEAAALLNGIEKGGAGFDLARQVMDAERELEELREQTLGITPRDPVKTQVSDFSSGDQQNGETNFIMSSSERLNEELAAKEREFTRLLAVLEREQPGLSQILSIKPLELAALQRRIPDGAVVLQYIPQPDKLMLHIIAKEHHEIRTVDVDRDELMTSAIRANLFLESMAPEIEGMLNKQSSIFGGNGGEKMPFDTPFGDLALLYELLFAPVERDLEKYDRIYVSAAGALNYAPFPALTRIRGEDQQYAVERYKIAMVPTSYLLSLVLEDSADPIDSTLIFGDPDGTLAGAKREANSVRNVMIKQSREVILRIGGDASVNALNSYGKQARTIHFATHGKLNADKPELSYLVMANGTRLSTIDIMNLPLANTQLAFLSACETARGSDGIEYATLARAFAHAGVPTTIASLWPVGDKSTLKLVEKFYADYELDSMSSLANAQREMIKSWGPLRHPAAWAAFEVFGRGWSRY